MAVVTCPECNASLKMSEGPRRKVRCPKCSHVFQPPEVPEEETPRQRPARPRRASSEVRKGVDQQEASRPRRRSESEKGAGENRGSKGRGWLVGGIAVGLVAILGAGAVIVLLSNRNAEIPGLPKTTTPPGPIAATPPPVEPPVPAVPPGKLPPVREPEPTPTGPPMPPPMPPTEGPEPSADEEGEVVFREPPPELAGLDVPELKESKEQPQLVTDPRGHTSAVRASVFAFNSRVVVTASADRSLRIWNVRTGDCLGICRLPIGPGAEGAINAATVSPDDRLIAVGGFPFGRGKYGVPIHLVAMANGRVLRTYMGHEHSILALAFSPKNPILASGDAGGTARMFSIVTGKTIHVLKGHTDRITRVAFSPDGQILATCSYDGTVRLWSARQGRTLVEIRDFPDRVLSVAFHPREPKLATGCIDGTIQLWDLQGKRLQQHKIVADDKIQVVKLRFSPNGKELLYGGVSFGGRAGIFDLEQGKLRLAFTRHLNTVMDVNWSRDGRFAVSTGGDDHETLVWRTSDGKVVAELKGNGKSVWGVGWRLDGKAIVWGNTNRGGFGRTPVEHSFVLDALDFGPAPEPAQVGRIALKLGPYSLRPLDFFRVAVLHEGRPLYEFRSPRKEDRIYSMTLVAGNRAVFGASFGMYLVDLKSGRVLREFIGHSGLVLDVSPSPDGRFFLSGSTDQMIKLWDPDRREPLLSLFVAGRDWIAWTPQGHYACSPRGETLMGWQTNQGIDRNARFHPAARFRKSLYRPEAIRLLLRDKSPEKALALLKAEPGGIAGVQTVMPPAVVITSPAPGERLLKEETVKVRARAKSTGSHPITALRLLVDGRPYRGLEGLRKIDPPKIGEVEAEWTVQLLPGKHTVAVLAESPVSKGSSPAVDLTRPGDDKKPPNLYVLAAGVSAYPGPLALNFAHKDAIVLERTLKSRAAGVFGKVETRLLTDRQATRKNILDGLEWLQKEVGPGDVAILFLAGHGDRDPQGRFHFLPVDFDPEKPRESTVSGEEMKARLTNMRGRVLTLLDACHSGAAAKKGLADDLVRDLVSEDCGVVVMCSSLGREYSMESPRYGHGFFTYGLVEALEGKADYNKDRYVYLHEADYYTYLRVRAMSEGRQNPTTGRPPQLRSFPLGRIEK